MASIMLSRFVNTVPRRDCIGCADLDKPRMFATTATKGTNVRDNLGKTKKNSKRKRPKEKVPKSTPDINSINDELSDFPQEDSEINVENLKLSDKRKNSRKKRNDDQDECKKHEQLNWDEGQFALETEQLDNEVALEGQEDQNSMQQVEGQTTQPTISYKGFLTNELLDNCVYVLDTNVCIDLFDDKFPILQNYFIKTKEHMNQSLILSRVHEELAAVKDESKRKIVDYLKTYANVLPPMPQEFKSEVIDTMVEDISVHFKIKRKHLEKAMRLLLETALLEKSLKLHMNQVAHMKFALLTRNRKTFGILMKKKEDRMFLQALFERHEINLPVICLLTDDGKALYMEAEAEFKAPTYRSERFRSLRNQAKEKKAENAELTKE